MAFCLAIIGTKGRPRTLRSPMIRTYLLHLTKLGPPIAGHFVPAVALLPDGGRVRHD
jgi:hypothetical protein